MAKYARPYLDSSVWISWLKGDIRDGVDRKAIVSDILRAAERGDFKVYVSAFSLAEVHKVAGDRHEKLAPDEAADILGYFENDYVVIVDVDRNVGEKAHLLCAEHPTLKPADAIHLASALRAKCDTILAWDRPLTKIERGDIHIEEPQIVDGQVEMVLEEERDA